MLKPESHCARTPRARAIAASLVFCLLASGCGLGLSPEERLARAEQAFASGEHRAAVIDAKNVLLDAPDNVDARLLLGRASLAVGDAATAEKALRRAVELGVPYPQVAAELGRAMLLLGDYRGIVAELDPETASDAKGRIEILRVLGDARMALGEPDAAREYYSRILEASPADRAAQLGVTMSYVAERNVLQARETLSRVLEDYPDFAEAWLTSGRLHMIGREFDAAVADYGRARELARQQELESLEVESVHGLADASLARNDLTEARRYAGVLETLAPNTIASLQIAGRLAYAESDWSLAQEKLGEVLRRAPRNNMARTMLGAVHLQSGNLGQAEMYLSAAVADEPRNADARRLLAETRLKLNKSDEAQLALVPLVEAEDADPRSLAMAARVDLLSGDFEGAASYLERSAAENPASANVELDLAAAYLLAGRIEDARAILDRAAADGNDGFRRDALQVLATSRTDGVEAALAAGARLRETWPDRAMAHLLHGAMLMSNGAAGEARGAFTAAGEAAPEDVTPLRYLARVDESEGQWAAAGARYREILERRPDDAGAMFSLGRVALGNENVAEAIDWFEQSRAAAPDVVAPRLVLAKLYLAEGRPDEAEAVGREALELNDGLADSHGVLGAVYLSRQQPAMAVEQYSRALELEPADRGLRADLARAQAMNGNPEQAVATLEAAEGDPLEHLPSGILLVGARFAAGDAQGALETARALRRAHPGNATPIALEAEALARSGDVQRAIEVYDEALGVEPTRRIAVAAYNLRRRADDAGAARPLERFLEARPLDTEVRVLLAQHQHQAGEVDAAIAEYRRVVDIAPDSFVALNNLAWLYFENGDARAESIARRAHARAPENPSVADTLGWILAKRDKLDEGIGVLREAVELTDAPEVRYHLAAALAASGESGEARRLLEEVLASDGQFPSRDEARTLLASL